jgi:alcohol dehydrogenase class IV
MVQSFSFLSATEIRFGFDTVTTVGQACRTLGLDRVLVVSDPFMVASGMVRKVTDVLAAEGIEHDVFSDFEASPAVSSVEKGARIMQERDYQGVIGFGGGSSLDTGKAIALLRNNPLPVSTYYGVEKVPAPACPMIMIPTTAGTGSEVSNACILKDDATHIKNGICSRYMIASIAIIDPALTLSMPPALTAATGMDALTHCIEGYVSNKSSEMTRFFHREALRLISRNLRNAVWNGGQEARYNVMLGATYAGWAMSVASLGACHAMAYPVEGKYGAAHGEANAALLPAVMRYNAVGNLEKFCEMAEAMGEQIAGLSEREAGFKAVAAVETLARDIRIKTLAELGMREGDVEAFAQISVKNERLMSLNPRCVDLASCMEIYRDAL